MSKESLEMTTLKYFLWFTLTSKPDFGADGASYTIFKQQQRDLNLTVRIINDRQLVSAVDQGSLKVTFAAFYLLPQNPCSLTRDTI